MIQLSAIEMLSVYMLLRRYEKDLDSIMTGAKNKIEEQLFDLLTIDQLENIEHLYALHGKKLVEILKLDKEHA